MTDTPIANEFTGFLTASCWTDEEAWTEHGHQLVISYYLPKMTQADWEQLNLTWHTQGKYWQLKLASVLPWGAGREPLLLLAKMAVDSPHSEVRAEAAQDIKELAR